LEQFLLVLLLHEKGGFCIDFARGKKFKWKWEKRDIDREKKRERRREDG
jgi:hypothetical protein